MPDLRPAVVDVGDCVVSGDPAISIVTYALGSCIAVTIHDPVAKVGGLLHLMLPESSLSREKAEQNPYLFADSGVPLLFHKAYRAGAEKSRLVVCLAGGAQVVDDKGIFNIGKRNYLAVRKLLWQAGVLVKAEDVGGGESRTVRLEVGGGAVYVRTSAGKERPLDAKAAAPSGRPATGLPAFAQGERRNNGVLGSYR
jgi:chemotaxis protein CheD